MKSQKLITLLFALILTALSSGATLAQTETEAVTSRAAVANDSFPFPDRRALPTGAWDVTINTAIQGGPFKALYTFTGDGVMLADEPGGAFETTGHGNWVRNGNRFDYTFIAYIGSANSALTAIIKVSGSVNLAADLKSWEGPGKLTVTAPNGAVLFQDQGTFKGARIAVEPLN